MLKPGKYGIVAALSMLVIGFLYASIALPRYVLYPLEQVNIDPFSVLVILVFSLLIYYIYDNLYEINLYRRTGLDHGFLYRVGFEIYLMLSYIFAASVIYSYQCFMQLKIDCISLAFIKLFLRVTSIYVIFSFLILLYVVYKVPVSQIKQLREVS